MAASKLLLGLAAFWADDMWWCFVGARIAFVFESGPERCLNSVVVLVVSFSLMSCSDSLSLLRLLLLFVNPFANNFSFAIFLVLIRFTSSCVIAGLEILLGTWT